MVAPTHSPAANGPLLPVNMSADGLIARAAVDGLSTDADNAVRIVPPDSSTLATIEQESYQLSSSLAVKLGFPIASLNTKDKVQVMVFGVARYSDVIAAGHTFRYGVAIRVMLKIYSTQNQASLTLPVIAAQAELGAVAASAQLMVHGFTGNLADELPHWESFDVDSYADYLTAISKVQKNVLGDPEHITPVLLSSTLAGALLDADDGDTGQRANGGLMSRMLHPRWSNALRNPDRDPE